MGMLVRAAVFMSTLLFCNALLDLSGPSEIEGVWKATTILPCSYVPVKDFLQQTLAWTVVHDQSSGTIFRRDTSGDHVLLSEYRDRVEVPKNSPGNVSLHILKLQFSDRGTYTCQVTWRASNNSLITKEISTRVEVVKVAVTKPVVRAGERGLTLPAGARTSLTCVAGGSPPISYRWFRGEPGGAAQHLSSGAELTFDGLRPSHSGKYYCEAENYIGALVTQQSDAVELVVRGLSATTVTFKTAVEITEGYNTTTDLPLTVMTTENKLGNSEKNHATEDFQKGRLPLYLVVLIAVICGAVVFLIIFLIICIRRPKNVHVYEVKFRNNSVKAEASQRFDSVSHYEEPLRSTENDYMTEHTRINKCEETNLKENEYGNPTNSKESEYEVGDTV